jgi:hypothetical protein
MLSTVASSMAPMDVNRTCDMAALLIGAADAEEDKLHGRDKTGDEMPEWVADKKRRAETIRKAKAELEEEAKAPNTKRTQRLRGASTEPDAKAQKNFTDPDSRIMKSKDGFGSLEIHRVLQPSSSGVGRSRL